MQRLLASMKGLLLPPMKRIRNFEYEACRAFSLLEFRWDSLRKKGKQSVRGDVAALERVDEGLEDGFPKIEWKGGKPNHWSLENV